VLSVSVGTTFGFALVFSFGKWLTPAAAIVLPNTGRIEEIRMPVGARKLEDVGTFVIKGGGGDDFGRVYVNNYLTHSGESPDLLFFTNSPNGKQARDEVMSYATNLNNYMLGDKDVVAFLRRGDNYIIQKLENSMKTAQKQRAKGNPFRQQNSEKNLLHGRLRLPIFPAPFLRKRRTA